MPAKDRPFLQRPLVEMLGLIGEVFREQRNHARVARSLLELRESFEHDVIRPPVLIFRGADPALGLLVVQRPVHPFPDFANQNRILGEIRQWNQAVQKVRSALPTLAAASQPSAVGSEVRPEFINVPAEPAGLNPQLFEQPAFWHDGSERQRIERIRLQRSAIWRCCRRSPSQGCGGQRQ